MDDRSANASLGERLRELDWSRGLTPAALVARLPDDPARGLIERHLPEGTYFSAQDVLSALPGHAWAETGGTARHDAELPGGASPTSRGADPGAAAGSLAAATQPEPANPAADPSRTGGAGPVDQARQVADQATSAVASSVAKVAAQAKERAAAQGSAAIAHLPDKVRQTASQARDRVVTIGTGSPESRQSPTPAPPTRRVTPVALSAVIEGLGQAYNRQPSKAVAFGVLGLTLSLVSGLNTWLARRILRDRDVTVGASRVRPLLLALWAATFAASLWDAWRNARAETVGSGSGDAAAGTTATWRTLDPSGPTPSPRTANAATDEYPTVG